MQMWADMDHLFLGLISINTNVEMLSALILMMHMSTERYALHIYTHAITFTLIHFPEIKYIYTYIWFATRIYIYIYPYVYMHVCICVYI